MAEKEKSMVEKILDTERAGYAYFYPRGGGNRQEFFISTTPENMANFLGSHFYDAEKMIITDMVDRLYQYLPGSEVVFRDYSLSCTDSDGREGSRGNLNGNQRGIRYVLCCRGPSSHDGRVSDDVSVFLWGINLV